jgi:hypothetical protein
MTKKRSDLPPGWDEKRVQELLDHYEHQTDEEAAAEHEAAVSRLSDTPNGAATSAPARTPKRLKIY